ncbi:MAG TPA: PrsW family glutamic-type intramembrane protease [bacterium]|jgi:RsiW-degrading membrane proteinase PrsW (M82 family)
MEAPLVLTLLIAPFAILISFFWVRDRWDKEPTPLLWLLLGTGGFSVIPIAVLGLVLEGTDLNFESFNKIHRIAFTSFITAGTIEEGVKYLLAILITFNHKYFTEEYDGIYYAVAVSLGFAFVENIMYVLQGIGGGVLGTAIIRAFTAVPLHAACGVVLGYHLGMAKFTNDRSRQITILVKGLLAAIFFHGIYDFFAFSSSGLEKEYIPWSYIALGITLFVLWAYCNMLIKDAMIVSARRHGLKHAKMMTPVNIVKEIKRTVRVEPANPLISRKLGISYCDRCGKIVSPTAIFCPGCGSEIN